MTTIMKTVLTLVIGLFLTGTIVVQMPEGLQKSGQSMNTGRFYGKVVDGNSKPPESASVQLSHLYKKPTAACVI